jgi:hypothetical protein
MIAWMHGCMRKITNNKSHFKACPPFFGGKITMTKITNEEYALSY